MPLSLTTVGANALKQALRQNQSLTLTHIALGSGSVGVDSTSLPNECYKGSISYQKDEGSTLVVGISLPHDTPAFSANCVGVYAKELLFAIGEISPITKPRFESNSAEIKQISLQLAINLNNAGEGVNVHIDSGVGVYVPLEDVSTTPVDNKVVRRDSDGYMQGKLRTSEIIIDRYDLAPASSDCVLFRHSSGRVFTQSLQDFLTSTAIPAGTVIAGVGSRIPAGFLLCNGAAISRSVYEKLFSAIGTIYGSGDGNTTFNLPDFRGRFLRGVGGNAASLGIAQSDEFKSHSHRISLPRNDGNVVTYFNSRLNSSSINYTLSPDENLSNNSFAYYDSGYTKEGGVETRPINYAIYWLIKF